MPPVNCIGVLNIEWVFRFSAWITHSIRIDIHDRKHLFKSVFWHISGSLGLPSVLLACDALKNPFTASRVQKEPVERSCFVTSTHNLSRITFFAAAQIIIQMGARDQKLACTMHLKTGGVVA